MTHKDHIAIADALREAQPYIGLDVARTQRAVDVDHIANVLAADNPRFDRLPFLAACGWDDR